MDSKEIGRRYRLDYARSLMAQILLLEWRVWRSREALQGADFRLATGQYSP